MEYRIAVIEGDGIGPEIVREARKVLLRIAALYGHHFEFRELLMGGSSIDRFGEPLTEETLEKCRASDAGSIGGKVGVSPWYLLPPEKRPEAGLLKLRKGLGLFCNLRPAKLYPELRNACPLRESVIGDGFDLMMVRELTGGLYFGARSTVRESASRGMSFATGNPRSAGSRGRPFRSPKGGEGGFAPWTRRMFWTARGFGEGSWRRKGRPVRRWS